MFIKPMGAMDSAAPLSVWPCAQQPSRMQRRGRYVPEFDRASGEDASRHRAPRYQRLLAPGDIVLDPMCGIGTTLVEAMHLGRKAVGVEYEPRWADVAEANLALAEAFGASGHGRRPRW